MNYIKNGSKAVAAISAGIVMSIGASTAQAYTMAGAVLEMEEFVILGSDGAILDFNTDFGGNLTFTGTADVNVSLNALSAGATGTNPPAEINLPLQCVGDCGAFGEDTYPHLTAAPTGNYAAGDQFESGAPIDNIPDFVSGAVVSNGSWAALDSLFGTGSADSNNNLNSSFVFALNNDQATGITFEFDVNAFLQAAVTADESFPTTATAATTFDFTLTDLGTGNEIWSFTPDGNVDAGDGETVDDFDLNQTISLNAPLPIDVELTRDSVGFASFSSTTGALAAGTLYQLSGRIITNADVLRAAVPEPGVLALLGIGLLGFGARRRNRTA